MDITRSTVRGSVALLLMLIVVFATHKVMLAHRDECGHHLERLVPALQAYAAEHKGNLPDTEAELAKALGTMPRSTINGGMVYQLTGKSLKWHPAFGNPEPYLWDPIPHPYLQGVHILYNDGTVRMEDNLTAGNRPHLPIPQHRETQKR